MNYEKCFFLLILFFLLSSCQKNEESIEIPLVPDLNNTLPTDKDTLKILAIGNSFTEDGLQEVPSILRQMGINNVVIGVLTYSSCSLAQHYDFYRLGSDIYDNLYVNRGIGNDWEAYPKFKIQSAIKYADWDIITLQQASDKAGIYNTYRPYLVKLLNMIYKDINNKKVVFAWHMTWAYASNSNHIGFKNYDRDQLKMYFSTVNATKELMSEIGIQIVIPSGTALQNLRNTDLNNPPADLTRDGCHLDLGIARYTLSCTWIQTLIAPCLGLDLNKNKIPYIPLNKGIPLTLDNYEICKKSAQNACQSQFSITK